MLFSRSKMSETTEETRSSQGSDVVNQEDVMTEKTPEEILSELNKDRQLLSTDASIRASSLYTVLPSSTPESSSSSVQPSALENSTSQIVSRGEGDQEGLESDNINNTAAANITLDVDTAANTTLDVDTASNTTLDVDTAANNSTIMAASDSSSGSSNKDWSSMVKEEDRGGSKSPDVIIEPDEEGEGAVSSDQPKLLSFRPFQLSRKLLSDAMEASFWNRTILIRPFSSLLLEDDTVRLCVQGANNMYMHAQAGQDGYIELYFATHNEAESNREKLKTHLQDFTVGKVTKEHVEGVMKKRDPTSHLVPRDETKAQYRERMLLVSLDIGDDVAASITPAPRACDVQDAALQMFGEKAQGVTIPVPRRSLDDGQFHGYILVLYRSVEEARAAFNEWKGKEIFILGKQIKIEQFQKVAAEALGQKKVADKEAAKKSPSKVQKAQRAMMQALLDNTSKTGSEQPLTSEERERLGQRVKEIKSSLTQIRHMAKNKSLPKVKQTMHRKLLQELKQLTKRIQGESADEEDDEYEEEEEEEATPDSSKPTATAAAAIQAAKVKEQKKKKINGAKKSQKTSFFTQPQYQHIYHAPPKKGPYTPPPVPAGIYAAPIAYGRNPHRFPGPHPHPNRPRFIPPPAAGYHPPPPPRQQQPPRPRFAPSPQQQHHQQQQQQQQHHYVQQQQQQQQRRLNMAEVHEVNQSLMELQDQVEQLQKRFATGQSLQQQHPPTRPQQGDGRRVGLLGDSPNSTTAAAAAPSMGRGRGRATHVSYDSYDPGYADEQENSRSRKTADLLMGLNEVLSQRMQSLNLNDYTEDQFNDYYEEDYGGGYQRVPRSSPGGYGEPVNNYYGNQHRNKPSLGGAGRGSGSYSQAKQKGFVQAQGRGRGLLHNH